MIAGLELARRLEAAEALNGEACAEAQQRLNPEVGATALEVAGGFAIYVGAESPLTHALGLGMRGSVAAGEIDRLEKFYCDRHVAVSVDLCPLADASLVDLLAQRGYRATEFNNVLVRPLPGAEVPPPDVPVRMAKEDEADLWSRTVGSGFLEKDELTPEEMDVGSTIWHMSGVRCYIASNRSQDAAAAAMNVRGGLALLFADSTMLGHRGAGLQAALIRERLRAAVSEGCDLATASTLPGSVSQRNYERNGFQVAYTKVLVFGAPPREIRTTRSAA